MSNFTLTRISDGVEYRGRTKYQVIQDRLELYETLEPDVEVLYKKLRESRELARFLKEHDVIKRLSNFIERYSSDEF